MESVEPVRGTGTDRAHAGAVAAVQRPARPGADDSRSRADNSGRDADGRQRHASEGSAELAEQSLDPPQQAGRDAPSRATGGADTQRTRGDDDAPVEAQAQEAQEAHARAQAQAAEAPPPTPPGSQLNVVFGGRPMAFTDVSASPTGGISTERVEFDARVIENNPERVAEDPGSRFWVNSGQRRFRSTAPEAMIEPGVDPPPPGSPADIGRRLFVLPEKPLAAEPFNSSLA